MEHENNLAFVRGKKRQTNDSSVAAEFGLPDEYCGQSAQDLLKGVVGEWVTLLTNDFEAGFKRVLQYDELSFRQYLRQVAQWPHEVIDFVEMMTSQTNQYDLSFTEVILQCLDFGTKEWATIKGGMSRLIDAVAKLVGAYNIHLNAPVTKVRLGPSGKVSLFIGGPSPTVRAFDKVIMAIPLPPLRNLLERPLWSPLKEQAIRSTYYEPLYKMGLHFRSRFWEQSVRPCFGGQSITDLRVRWLIYPSNDLGSNGSGVLLVYSWMTDAALWSAMPFEDRVQLALHDLGTFFAEDNETLDVAKEFIEAFDVTWSSHSSTGGCGLSDPDGFKNYPESGGWAGDVISGAYGSAQDFSKFIDPSCAQEFRHHLAVAASNNGTDQARTKALQPPDLSTVPPHSLLLEGLRILLEPASMQFTESTDVNGELELVNASLVRAVRSGLMSLQEALRIEASVDKTMEVFEVGDAGEERVHRHRRS
ncbi:flavin-containing amine oxidoreductase-domain containing protein [Aspergillus floccosus]